MSTISALTAKLTNIQDAAGANGSTPQQIQQGRAKAWFNLDGTGTIAARDSFGMSSFTDLGVGSYSVAYATPQPNSGGCVNVSAGNSPGGNGVVVINASTGAPSNTGFAIACLNPGATATVDQAHVMAELTGD